MSKPMLQTLKGFRDFLPQTMAHRATVLHTLEKTVQAFGFAPIETPTLEYASLLLGKYGEEADSLVYTFHDKGDRNVGLRYDQTVPTARVLSQYQHQLPQYFRRYQTQSVFRADKPQQGRYREFRQFDLDIFGSTHAIADAEILACTYAAFKALGCPSAQLIINDRQTLLDTLSPFSTDQVSVFSIIQSIDKLDKLSPESVAAELVKKGLKRSVTTAIISEIEKADLSQNLQDIVQKTISLGVPKENIIFSPKLARGLDYYTGMIFEVIIPEYSVGSVGGGGRYDNLIADLGGPQIPAVGMAFGFDRVVEALLQLGILPDRTATTQVLVTVLDEESLPTTLQTAAHLRAAGIKTEVFPTPAKLSKQIKTADQQAIPFAIVIGSEEIATNTVTLKQLQHHKQITVSLEEAIAYIHDFTHDT